MAFPNSKAISSASQIGSLGRQGTNSKKVMLFTEDSGQFTEEALYLCKLLTINPNDLVQKTFEDFGEKGVSEKIQRIRFEHYEEKRQKKLKAIQNVLMNCSINV